MWILIGKLSLSTFSVLHHPNQVMRVFIGKLSLSTFSVLHHPNQVMRVFIGKLSLSTLNVLHHLVLAKLATSSIRVELRVPPI